MALVAAALLPHPKKPDAKTVAGFGSAKKLLLQKKVELLIVVSPRVLAPTTPYSPGPTDSTAYYMHGLDKVQASLPTRSPDMPARIFDNDTNFVRLVKERARPFGLPIQLSPTIQLDEPTSAALIQLFGGEDAAPKLVSVVLPYLAPKDLLEFGQILGGVADQYMSATAIVAVGDLSARLTKDSPAGFDPAGAEFDQMIKSAAKNNDFMPILSADPASLEKAGEEASRPLAVVASAVKSKLKSKLVSYQAPDGIGHAVLTWS